MTDKKTLIDAMFNVQQQAPSITKSTNNPFFKSQYADMGDIWDAIKPILGEQKLHIGHTVIILENGDEVLKTIITHVPTNEKIESDKKILLQKQTAQDFGSYMTYMRRYMVTSMLGLVIDNDDDGNSASQQKQTTTQESKQIIKQVDDMIAQIKSANEGGWLVVEGEAINLGKSLPENSPSKVRLRKALSDKKKSMEMNNE